MTTWPGYFMPGAILVTIHFVSPVILYGTLKVTVVAPLPPP